MPMTVHRPHLKYREIKPEAIDAAVAMFEAKPWRLATIAEKIEAVTPFVAQICEAYRANPAPRVVVSPHLWGRVSYRPGQRFALSASDTPGTLSLKRFTMIDLFTGIRQHINHVTGSRLDAFAWACSLFYAVKPTMFRARVREGRIPGVVARATYTQETWDALVSEGRADERTGRLVVEEVPSEETMDAVADYVDALIDEEATDGIAEIEEMLSDAVEDTDYVEDLDPLPLRPAEDHQADDVENMNRDALRAEAARLNIPGRGSMLAADLRVAIRRARANG